ncbi:hypothetical protein [Shewanella sp. MBTL60-007]|uniref:hypothetical protein n=1 Tax=Shewanella sp. MBTL60-007 TaxID=2815911 RepID=UPI001BBCEABF|nr:hypothetical protein [Shewanella sp. MBTL60-007]GIU13090.1 hypothetical protein TUM3792_02360 [Shewanella sp. MBTL60-007]
MNIQKMCGVLVLISWTIFLFILQLPEAKSDISYSYLMYAVFPACALASYLYILAGHIEVLNKYGGEHNPRSWGYHCFTGGICICSLVIMGVLGYLISLRVDNETAIIGMTLFVLIIFVSEKVDAQLTKDLNSVVDSLETTIASKEKSE